jgi:electron transfer flavoprotein beta subunit
VRKIVIEGKKLTVERVLEDGFERIETSLPALITVIKDLNKPRYPSVKGIVEACREAEYPVWTAKDIGADPTMIGLDGSLTQVKRSFAPEPHGEGIMLEGTVEEMSKELVSRLKDDNVVG